MMRMQNIVFTKDYRCAYVFIF